MEKEGGKSVFFIAVNRKDNTVFIEEVKPGQVIPKLWEPVPAEYHEVVEPASLVVVIFEEGSRGALLCALMSHLQKMSGSHEDMRVYLEDFAQIVWTASQAYHP